MEFGEKKKQQSQLELKVLPKEVRQVDWEEEFLI